VRGLKEISHNGGLNGFLSSLLRFPDEKFTVAVLVNASPPPPNLEPGGLAHRIVPCYLADKMAERPTYVVDKSASPKAYDAYVGRYDYGAVILTVTRVDDHLYAQVTGQPRHEIFPKSQSEFFWRVVDARVTFVKDEQGAVIKAVHHQNGATINAPRLPEQTAAKLDPALLDACVGKYDYGNGKAIMTVTREGNGLFAQLTGQPKFEIFPKSETVFFWKVVNAEITFVKDDRGKVIKGIHQQNGQKFDAPKIE
jgi:hypothetical protein